MNNFLRLIFAKFRSLNRSLTCEMDWLSVVSLLLTMLGPGELDETMVRSLASRAHGWTLVEPLAQ